MTIILNLDEEEALRQLDRRRGRVRLEAYSADITDDGKVVMLNWDYGDCTYVQLKELLIAYMEKHGIL